MSEASPEDGSIETENEDSEDEYLIATCEHCGQPIMTLIGGDEDEWVHEKTEFLECAEPEGRKPSKAELLEFVTDLAEDGHSGARHLLGLDE